MALDCIVSHPGGGEGIIHLTEPNGEETRPGLEVGDTDGEDAFCVVVAFLLHVGDLRGLAARDSHVDTECL